MAADRVPGRCNRDAGLDDLVLLDVELPPGTATGPIIGGRELARLEVHSPPGQ